MCRRQRCQKKSIILEMKFNFKLTEEMAVTKRTFSQLDIFLFEKFEIFLSSQLFLLFTLLNLSYIQSLCEFSIFPDKIHLISRLFVRPLLNFDLDSTQKNNFYVFINIDKRSNKERNFCLAGWKGEEVLYTRVLCCESISCANKVKIMRS